MICCVGTFPLALICGPLRGIPWGWTLVDFAFGTLALPGLYLCWKWSKALEHEENVAMERQDGKIKALDVKAA